MRPSHHRLVVAIGGGNHAVERLEPRHLLAASLLADLNSTTVASNPYGLVNLGGTGYFVASNPEHGREIWTTDGTPEGTRLFADLNPGPAGSINSPLAKVGSKVFFEANDGQGAGLWATDGTAAGTIRLTNDAVAYNQIVSGGPADLNGVAFFGGVHSGVWRSDGTVAGTTQIASLEAGSVARLGDNIDFLGKPLGGGPVALWRSDGTAAGTTPIRQFPTSYVTNMSASLDGRLYFWAADGALGTGVEPWSSDGTAEGTVPLGDLAAGTTHSAGTDFVSFNGAVYFLASTRADFQGIKLFRTDGTAGSATVIADLGLNSLTSESSGLIVYNGAVYLAGRRPGYNVELWRSDGTPEGTGAFGALSYPSAFTIFDGRLYFRAQTAATGLEMFSTDGTAEGTSLLKDIVPGHGGSDSYPVPTQVFNGRLYFRADDALHGAELWSTDGTADGTTLLKDINTHTNDFFPQYLQPGSFTPGPGGSQYFVAHDGVRGNALWKTDGTAAGTSFIKPFFIIPPWYIGPFAHVNGLLLFGAYESVNNMGGPTGFELWRSDGTEAGTFVVKDIAPGTASGFGRVIITVGNRIFFRASPEPGNSSRSGLWVSDGTEAGTRQVLSRADGIDFGLFSGGSLGGRLIFHAHTYPAGPEWNPGSIFITDGTPEGTHLVKGGFRAPGAANWTEFNGHAYFTAAVDGSGIELWRSDGTEQGTVMLGDITPGDGSSSPKNLIATPDWLHFTATDPANGRELWRINAQLDQPQRLTTLDSDIDQVQLAAAGRGVIFTTSAGDLYRFDGTTLIALKSASTFSIAPKLLGSDRWFNYFSAGTSAAGNELWKTDGTSAGTVVAQDLVPGPDGSWPQSLAAIGRKVVVSAYMPEVGRELFVFPSFGALQEEMPGPMVPPSRPSLVPAGGGSAGTASLPRMIDLLGDDAVATLSASAGA